MENMKNRLAFSFENLPEPFLPKNLKSKTIRRILIYKFRFLIYALTALLSLNLVLLANHIYQGIIRSGLLSGFGVGSRFTLSPAFIRSLLAASKIVTPKIDSISIVVNIILIVGALGFYQHYRNEIFK